MAATASRSGRMRQSHERCWPLCKRKALKWSTRSPGSRRPAASVANQRISGEDPGGLGLADWFRRELWGTAACMCRTWQCRTREETVGALSL